MHERDCPNDCERCQICPSHPHFNTYQVGGVSGAGSTSSKIDGGGVSAAGSTSSLTTTGSSATTSGSGSDDNAIGIPCCTDPSPEGDHFRGAVLRLQVCLYLPQVCLCLCITTAQPLPLPPPLLLTGPEVGDLSCLTRRDPQCKSAFAEFVRTVAASRCTSDIALSRAATAASAPRTRCSRRTRSFTRAASL